jgi:hypothetical protein
MKTHVLTDLLVGAISRASAKRNNKKIRFSYSLDFENRTVSIQEADLIFKEVTVNGHIGSGNKWKSKKWVETGAPKRNIFTGKPKDVISFLDNGAVIVNQSETTV